jgi:hypothetical protein
MSDDESTTNSRYTYWRNRQDGTIIILTSDPRAIDGYKPATEADFNAQNEKAGLIPYIAPQKSTYQTIITYEARFLDFRDEEIIGNFTTLSDAQKACTDDYRGGTLTWSQNQSANYVGKGEHNTTYLVTPIKSMGSKR